MNLENKGSMKKPVESGDILPAREAIALLDEIDLGPTIDLPPVPPEAHPENIPEDERRWLKREIARLKRERNAIVLAHNYMPPDVQDVADIVGDSLLLAKEGSESDADVLLESAVLFMNEILAIRKKPHQIVLAPDKGALCSLAAHADVRKIRDWKAEYPQGAVITYVNTYIDVKAESDYCCASANYGKVMAYALERHKTVLFGPDVYLGFHVAKWLQKMGYSLDRLFLIMGACHVHDQIRPHHVDEQRRLHPEAAVVVHPECGCSSGCTSALDQGLVTEQMMQFRSTQGMVKFLQETPQREIIVATETGNLYPMQKIAPDKVLIPANREAVCPFMKQNTLHRVWNSLKNMVYEITVDPELAKRARIPLDRMLSIN